VTCGKRKVAVLRESCPTGGGERGVVDRLEIDREDLVEKVQLEKKRKKGGRANREASPRGKSRVLPLALAFPDAAGKGGVLKDPHDMGGGRKGGGHFAGLM